MSPRGHVVEPARLAPWCMEHLGSPPADEIFRSGFLSAVIGLRLADSREVVVKVRPDSPRIAACVEVQRRLFQAGYPCPQPLTDAAAFGDDVATAEAYVPSGATLPGADHAARAFAEAFARLIRTVYPTRGHAIRDIARYIEHRYNSRGLHPALSYRTPNEVHNAYQPQKSAA